MKAFIKFLYLMMLFLTFFQYILAIASIIQGDTFFTVLMMLALSFFDTYMCYSTHKVMKKEW